MNKVGRPPLPKDQVHTARFFLALKATELKAWRKAAADGNLSLAELIRRAMAEKLEKGQ